MVDWPTGATPTETLVEQDRGKTMQIGERQQTQGKKPSSTLTKANLVAIPFINLRRGPLATSPLHEGHRSVGCQKAHRHEWQRETRLPRKKIPRSRPSMPVTHTMGTIASVHEPHPRRPAEKDHDSQDGASKNGATPKRHLDVLVTWDDVSLSYKLRAILAPLLGTLRKTPRPAHAYFRSAAVVHCNPTTYFLLACIYDILIALFSILIEYAKLILNAYIPFQCYCQQAACWYVEYKTFHLHGRFRVSRPDRSQLVYIWKQMF